MPVADPPPTARHAAGVPGGRVLPGIRSGGRVLASLSVRGRARLARAINISFDRFRIWYKITYARGRILATEGEGWKALDRAEYLVEPGLFYGADGRVPPVVEKIVGHISGAEITRFTFPTLHPMRYPQTNVAVGRLYRNTRVSDAPLVMISHGWAHRSLTTVEHLYVKPFLRAGFSVVFVMHPLHFERTPPGAYSGELVVSADLVLTVEAFRQGVIDMLGAANWLRATGRSRIGLFGYSLGAYLAGIMGAVRGDWEFLVMGAAGDSPSSPILDTDLGTNIREDLAACGMLDRERVTRSWRVISPGSFRPRVPKERILLIAGRYDRIILPASVRRLWNAWGRPRLQWLDRGHYGLLATNRGLMAHAVRFMRQVGGPEPGARPPAVDATHSVEDRS